MTLHLDALDPGLASADPLAGLTTSDRVRPALHSHHGTVTYGDLDDAVAARSARLRTGPAVLRAALHPVRLHRDADSVVELLAAWRARRAVLVLPPGEAHDRVLDAWPERGPHGNGYALHPDLALLMSTSGSTGSPKLVRLSHQNLASNASSISHSLRLTPRDVALATLPLHYCYGLSVLTSHLRSRASVVLTDDSVAHPDTWELANRLGVTSFAGVPHTFELLERSGLADRVPSSLRYVTQAGGRMEPEAVRAWAGRGRRHGFDLVVMYGQTEATARMAWLPPHLVPERPDAIGVAIPGGRLRVEPLASDDGLSPGVGELVYEGPNVMMGYATGPLDLGRGAEVPELHTGDLGVRDPDGVFRIVGRLSRFAKVYGLRIDLDGAERSLTRRGIEARVLEDRAGLCVFVAGPPPPGLVTLISSEAGLPTHAVRIVTVDELPLGPQGKRDDTRLRALLATGAAPASPARVTPLEEQVRSTYALLLARPDATLDDSFVELRGDSLSFVEANVRLASLIGEVPPDWPHLTPRQLADSRCAPETASRDSPPGRSARWPRVDSSMVLRALAIVLVIGSHTDLWMVPGGAHTLLALVGFSLVRFHLDTTPKSGEPPRSRQVVTMLGRVVAPAVLVMATVSLVRGTYDAATVVGLNNLLGGDEWSDQWRMWFVEAIVWGLALVALALRVPALERCERRAPYAVPAALLVVTLLARWAWIGWEADNPQRYAVPFVWSFLLLGWLAARSETTRLKLTTTAAALITTIGFFGDPVREVVVLAALGLLVWVPQLRLPAWLVPAVGVVAASSLWVYLVHWEVYPPVEEVSEALAFAVSFASGILAWRVWTRLSRSSRRSRWVGPR